jgi:hypothetical protein
MYALTYCTGFSELYRDAYLLRLFCGEFRLREVDIAPEFLPMKLNGGKDREIPSEMAIEFGAALQDSVTDSLCM